MIRSARSSHFIVSLATVFVTGLGVWSCKTPAPDNSAELLNRETPVEEPALEIDAGVGEKQWPQEVASQQRIAQAVVAMVQSTYDSGHRPAVRDAHPKHHGCVAASFEMNSSLPDKFQTGVFKPGKSYKAWIRYSNGSADPSQPDIKGDGRGMAIKIFGVPGEKILGATDERGTQDFLMINHPVFFADDPERYQETIEAARNGARLKALISSGFRGAKEIIALQGIKISNPLQTQYFSMVPYRLGVGAGSKAVKYSAKPCSVAKDPMPGKDAHPDYLRAAMQNTLSRGDACFEFMVQVSQDFNSMPVEDPITEWSQSKSPFVKVATIHIPKQNFTSDAQQQFCEQISMNPWHATAEHRPLGAINRARRVAYEASSKFRHQLNQTPRQEPTGNETFN